MARSQVVTVDLLRRQARRRMPRFAFDFIDGGAGDEASLRRNRAAFETRTLMPRVMVDTDGEISTRRHYLGRDWAVPFGMAPVGLAGIAWPGIDRMIAGAAEEAGAPYTTSTPSTTLLEDLKKVAPKSALFQLYVGKNHEIVEDLVARAADAGYDTMMVTADVPRPGNRKRDIVNGFALPLKIGPRMVFDLATHPHWALATLKGGPPRFANLERYAEGRTSTRSLAELMAGQTSGRLDWRLLADIRKRWSGKIVLKGVMAPQDAARAASEGIDAVQISNHGGRQLESAPATLDALGAVRAAVPAGYPLALDGGVRSGEDILKALQAGADFVFMGRPFLYAAAALGAAGPGRLFAMLTAELTNAMAQLGLRSLNEIRAE